MKSLQPTGKQKFRFIQIYLYYRTPIQRKKLRKIQQKLSFSKSLTQKELNIFYKNLRIKI